MREKVIRITIMAAFVVCMTLFPLTAFGYQCPKCHGSGWQTTIPDVGHYGVERTKQKCPVCGDWVFSGHKDKCTKCGGSGYIDDGRSSDRNDSYSDQRAAEGEASITMNLTSEENSLRANLMNSLFAEKFVVDTCQVCHGSKTCPQCGGVITYNLEIDPSMICVACGGDGMCPACRGQGSTGSHTEFTFSQEEREQIARNIGVFTRLANLRASRGISPNDSNGPRIAIDNDGNYYIEGESSGDNGYGNGDSGVSRNLAGFINHSGSSHTWLYIAVAVVVLVIIILSRRKRRK